MKPIHTLVTASINLPDAEADFKLHGKIVKKLSDVHIDALVEGIRKAITEQNNKMGS
jgi:hypothetical protein